jgi:TPR repeat protein
MAARLMLPMVNLGGPHARGASDSYHGTQHWFTMCPAHRPSNFAQTSTMATPSTKKTTWILLALLAVVVLVSVFVASFRLGVTAQSAGQFRLARLLYAVSAWSGNADAQNNLAGLYAQGLGGVRDDQTAAQWFEKAALSGIPSASFNLANFYEEGRGVPKDVGKAIQWFEQAASGGDVEAAFNLGRLYEQGTAEHPRNIERAQKWYRLSADRGYASAQYNLGLLYAHGADVPRDLRQSAEWLSKAAAQDHPKAQLDLGTMYALELGVERDIARGVSLIRKAAEHPVTADDASVRLAGICGAIAGKGFAVPQCQLPVPEVRTP